MIAANIYRKKGYKSRLDYLKSVAKYYNMDENVVVFYANLLGANEDFDGLLCVLDEYNSVEFV